jgi:hypothetical protein
LAIQLQNKKKLNLKIEVILIFKFNICRLHTTPIVLEKIIPHKQPLNIAESNNVKFENIIEDLEKYVSPTN